MIFREDLIENMIGRRIKVHCIYIQLGNVSLKCIASLRQLNNEFA